MRAIRLTILFAVVVLQASFGVAEEQQESKQPNILWLYQEDLSPWLGCYGYEIQKGHTPTIDAMAANGVRFSRAFVPAPVCSICRSAIITGANQIRFGAHEHRSRRGKASLPLPEGMKTIADLMTERGYFCFNVGKTDYNFEHSKVFQKIPKTQNKTPWRVRKDGQPFFGQIQLKGGKTNTKKFANKTDRSKVTIPGDYPQTDLYREVVAEHLIRRGRTTVSSLAFLRSSKPMDWPSQRSWSTFRIMEPTILFVTSSSQPKAGLMFRL